VDSLAPGRDYMLFRAGIEPMWEDPRNQDGGRWVVNLSKYQYFNGMNDLWLNTLAAVVDEWHCENDQVQTCVIAYFFFNSITKYINEYFEFTQLHYQLNQYVKTPITFPLSITLPII